jgi:branched-subunit amino acid transport protein
VSDLLAMIVLGVICWTFRIAFVLLIPAERLPDVALRGLEFLAPAVLAAIAAVELTTVISGGDARGMWASLAAVGAVVVVARLTRNLTAVVGVGLLAIILIDLVMS